MAQMDLKHWAVGDLAAGLSAMLAGYSRALWLGTSESWETAYGERLSALTLELEKRQGLDLGPLRGEAVAHV